MNKGVLLGEGIRLGVRLIIITAVLALLHFFYRNFIPGEEMTEHVLGFMHWCEFLVGFTAGFAIVFIISDTARQLEQLAKEMDSRFMEFVGIGAVSVAETLMVAKLFYCPALWVLIISALGIVLTNWIALKIRAGIRSLVNDLIAGKDIFFEE